MNLWWCLQGITPVKCILLILANYAGYDVIRFVPSFIYRKYTAEDIVFDLFSTEFVNKGYHIFIDKLEIRESSPKLFICKIRIASTIQDSTSKILDLLS